MSYNWRDVRTSAVLNVLKRHLNRLYAAFSLSSSYLQVVFILAPNHLQPAFRRVKIILEPALNISFRLFSSRLSEVFFGPSSTGVLTTSLKLQDRRALRIRNNGLRLDQRESTEQENIRGFHGLGWVIRSGPLQGCTHSTPLEPPNPSLY